MLPVNSLQTLVVLDIKTEEFPISQSTHCGRVSAGGSYALLNTSIEAHSYIVSFGEEKKVKRKYTQNVTKFLRRFPKRVIIFKRR